MLSRWQAVIWTNDALFYWHLYALLGLNELIQMHHRHHTCAGENIKSIKWQYSLLQRTANVIFGLIYSVTVGWRSFIFIQKIYYLALLSVGITDSISACLFFVSQYYLYGGSKLSHHSGNWWQKVMCNQSIFNQGNNTHGERIVTISDNCIHGWISASQWCHMNIMVSQFPRHLAVCSTVHSDQQQCNHQWSTIQTLYGDHCPLGSGPYKWPVLLEVFHVKTS